MADYTGEHPDYLILKEEISKEDLIGGFYTPLNGSFLRKDLRLEDSEDSVITEYKLGEIDLDLTLKSVETSYNRIFIGDKLTFPLYMSYRYVDNTEAKIRYKLANIETIGVDKKVDYKHIINKPYVLKTPYTELSLSQLEGADELIAVLADFAKTIVPINPDILGTLEIDVTGKQLRKDNRLNTFNKRLRSGLKELLDRINAIRSINPSLEVMLLDKTLTIDLSEINKKVSLLGFITNDLTLTVVNTNGLLKTYNCKQHDFIYWETSSKEIVHFELNDIIAADINRKQILINSLSDKYSNNMFTIDGETVSYRQALEKINNTSVLEAPVNLYNLTGNRDTIETLEEDFVLVNDKDHDSSVRIKGISYLIPKGGVCFSLNKEDVVVVDTVGSEKLYKETFVNHKSRVDNKFETEIGFADKLIDQEDKLYYLSEIDSTMDTGVISVVSHDPNILNGVYPDKDGAWVFVIDSINKTSSIVSDYKTVEMTYKTIQEKYSNKLLNKQPNLQYTITDLIKRSENVLDIYNDSLRFKLNTTILVDNVVVETDTLLKELILKL